MVKNFLISLLYLLGVLVIAFLSDKLIEFITFMFTYTIIRNEFTKAVHGSNFTSSAHKGIIYCRIITMRPEKTATIMPIPILQ